MTNAPPNTSGRRGGPNTLPTTTPANPPPTTTNTSAFTPVTPIPTTTTTATLHSRYGLPSFPFPLGAPGHPSATQTQAAAALQSLSSTTWSNSLPQLSTSRPSFASVVAGTTKTSIRNQNEDVIRPLVPAYLEGSTFAELVEEMRSKEEKGEMQEGDLDLRLPTAFNPKDKFSLLDLHRDGMRVSYGGKHPGKEEPDAASVRANHPIPSQCGLFYYEVEIISKGREGQIGIGFCHGEVELNRLPGWNLNSYGYHGDDGNIFNVSGEGKSYGPQFTTNDIVGCGINFRDNTAFYTRNGFFLGIAFKDIPDTPNKPFYPCVGFRTPGEEVEVNFGLAGKPFAFDIVQYVKEEKMRLLKTINQIPLPGPNSCLSYSINELILSYFIHHGLAETAKSFAQDIGVARDTIMNGGTDSNELEGEEDMRWRQKIRAAILSGDIDTAVTLTNKRYPTVLRENPKIFFQLKCRKFVEMMTLLGSPAEPSKRSSASLTRGAETEMEEYLGVRTDDVMEVDDENNSGASSSMNIDDVAGLEGPMGETMKFGRALQMEYGSDDDEEVRQKLVETFSLLAYPNLKDSPVAYLLDPKGREPVADGLNSAILVSQNRPPIAPLEQTFRQAAVSVKEIVKLGVAGFISIKNDCMV